MARQMARPRKAGLGMGWQWWDKAAEGMGLVVALPLLPIAALERSFRQYGQRSKVAQFRREYERTLKQMELASRQPSDFLAVYFKQLQILRASYSRTHWHSLREAEQGYALLKAAEEALLAEAKAVIERLPKV